MMAETFPGLSISTTTLCRFIRDIFPNSSVKRVGKKRVNCVIGIEKRQKMPLDSTASCSHVHAMTPISGTMSPTVITTLSCNTPGATSSISKDKLLLELALERSRRIALERENDTLKKTVQAGSVSSVQSAAEYQHILSSEINSAVGLRAMLLHGPDTIEHFAEFSMTTTTIYQSYHQRWS